jgi:hypothetical protein
MQAVHWNPPRRASNLGAAREPFPSRRRGPGRRRPALEPVRRGDGGATDADAEPAAGLIDWVRERVIPLPPRCRNGVNSPYLPASPFQAPGDAVVVAPAVGRCVGSFTGGARISPRKSRP